MKALQQRNISLLSASDRARRPHVTSLNRLVKWFNKASHRRRNVKQSFMANGKWRWRSIVSGKHHADLARF